jgi:hypothetical protein
MKRVPVRSLASSLFFAALAAIGTTAVAQPPGTGTVPIYDSTQIALDRYTVVRRIGITGWESAFRIRGHADVESAQRALLAEAARAGADGVINLICFDKTDRIFKPAGYFCYGNAIRIRK